jgi:flagellar hook protein FlgE
VDGTTTVADLVAAISGAYANATASLEADGRISLEADATGPAYLSLSLRNDTANVGTTDFSSNNILATREGKNGDSVRGGLQVFDLRGGSHTVELEFTKQADGTWSLAGELSGGGGTVTDGSVTGLNFNDDGTFSYVSGSGAGDPAMTFQFDGQSNPQTVAFSFGTSGDFDGLTSLTTPGSISTTQDGSTSGSLLSVSIDGDGVIEGIASNGRRFALAQLAVASFSNPNGLEAIGQNYFGDSVASGDVQLGTARAGGRGSIRAGELEQSNVDLALEFTRLIVAQRGFSANARTITVADEILEEVTNLVR